LFPAALGKTGKLSRRPLVRTDAADMLKRRLKQAGLPAHYSPHSFRATGITNFLENDGRSLDLAHPDPRSIAPGYAHRRLVLCPKPQVALLWQNQTGSIHVRRRSNPEGLSTGEWYRRMTFMELNRKLTHLLKGRTIQSESGDEGQCADYIRRRIHAKAQGRRPGDNKRGSEG
jgi:hypothetical protein